MYVYYKDYSINLDNVAFCHMKTVNRVKVLRIYFSVKISKTLACITFKGNDADEVINLIKEVVPVV